jgi:membrane protein DedA with SNARE-associated domain
MIKRAQGSGEASLAAAGVIEVVIEFVRDNEVWAAPSVFALAFLESFAFLSLIVPATVILFGVGALIGAAGLGFVPLYVAAVAGAFFGDWLAFELALWLGPHVSETWPISRNPGLLQRASEWFERWGPAAIFLGRFFGPMRAGMPLVAGVLRMPRTKFQIANLASALVWAAGILTPGTFGARWLLA